MFLLYNENSNNIETSTLALTRFKAQQPAPPVATAVAMAADWNQIISSIYFNTKVRRYDLVALAGLASPPKLLCYQQSTTLIGFVIIHIQLWLY